MLTPITNQFAKGGSGLSDGTLAATIKELQGLTVTVVAGAAAAAKMDVAALRSEDHLLAAICTADAGGATTNDVANMSIVGTKAGGTITISGNPVADDTFVVNGVTYTFKATPADIRHVKIIAGDNTAMAARAAAAINAYEGRGNRAPDVVATSALGVVTLAAVADGAAGNAITLTEAGTNVAVTGAGTLTGGSATGGVTSTTDLTGKTVTLMWYNKR